LGAGLAAVATALRASTVRVVDGRRGAGSGVVWSAGGTIVTNAHVVRGRRPTAIFEDGRDYPAEVITRDERRDLALLQIDAAPLDAVAVRDAATLRPGELVVAVGNPLGFVGALSAGVVQRCNARWVIADVRLAPGNSGGPLADAHGRVVGINSMVAGGLALAVPSEAVRTLAAARGAAPQRLGVSVVAVTLPAGARGVAALLVTGTEPGGAAERAGLALGDAIVGTDSGPVEGFSSIAERLGGAASLDVVRAGRGLRITIPHGTRDESFRAA
jgi:serine protease Do